MVTGVRLKPEQLKDTVWSFVGRRQRLSRIGQVARWRDPVCPQVKNLPPGFDAFISARIEAIAASVGAPTKQPCKPNIEIIFTAKPQVVMDEVAKHTPVLLGYHFQGDTERLARMTQPIQAWYVTATSNGTQTRIDDPYGEMPGGAAGSRLSDGLRSVFLHVLILADTDKIAGHEVGPVADYLAMLALSDVEMQSQCSELPSILDLFAADCPAAQKPGSLTAADKAFLEGVYSASPGTIGPLEQAEIADQMIASLKTANPSEAPPTRP